MATSAVLSLPGSSATGSEWRTPGHLRIGIGHLAPQTFTAKDHHETVLLYRLDEDLKPWDRDLSQRDGQRGTLFGRNTAGTAIR